MFIAQIIPSSSSTVAEAVMASWNWRPGLLLLLLLSAAVYFAGWQRLQRMVPDRFPAWRLASYLGGLAVFYFSIVSPLDAFANLLLTAHMAQHLLLSMVAPVLILVGQPYLPVLCGLPRRWVREGISPFLHWPAFMSVVHRITHPVTCWILFVASNVIWHLPPFYEAALRSPGIHQTEHLFFFGSALLFWWHVLLPWPGRSVWPRWAFIPYLLLADLQNTILGAVFSFSDRIIYPSYMAAPNMAGLTPLEDQAGAGAMMWVLGSIAFLAAAAVIALHAIGSRNEANDARPAEERTFKRTTALSLSKRTAAKTLDLLRLPFLPLALRIPWVRRTLQALCFGMAALIVVDGWLGPQVSPLNFAGVLPWTHWRAGIVLALLVFGNLFCMACPFTFARDLGRRLFHGNRPWPRFLRSKWIAVALVVFYFWAYETFALWDRPAWTATIVIGYFAAALLVDGWFKGASFCKYVCPIGQFHFTQSLISPFEVKALSSSVCASCTTHDCLVGNEKQRGCELDLYLPTKQGNMDCTFCLDCAQACPHDNVGLVHVPRGADIWSEGPRSGVGSFMQRRDLALLVLVFVAAAFVNAAGMIQPVLAWQDGLLAGTGPAARTLLLGVLVLAGLLLVPIALVSACAWIGRRAAASDAGFREVACRFIYGLVPLGFSMWLAHFGFHFLTGWGTLWSALGRTIPGLEAAAWSPPTWVGDLLIPYELVCLDAGLIFTWIALWKIGGLFQPGSSSRLRLTAPWMVLALGLFLFGAWIFFQPMEMRGTLLK